MQDLHTAMRILLLSNLIRSKLREPSQAGGGFSPILRRPLNCTIRTGDKPAEAQGMPFTPLNILQNLSRPVSDLPLDSTSVPEAQQQRLP